MGALRQPRLDTTAGRKPITAETRKLDKYGRDPESLPERLRLQTDYSADTGYSPLYHAVLADLPRLSSGAVCYAFVLVVNMLSLGRSRKANSARESWTLPISAVDLAELCRANVRDIQRQLAQLQERGLIGVKQIKTGGVKYSVSLLYTKWRDLEDYAVWKRRQVVAIDEPDDSEETEDESPAEISKDAVHLTRKPQTVRPGRASRPLKVNCGVKELSFQNESASVDTVFSAVVTSGRLVVSASSRLGESEAKGESKANAERHACRAIPPNEGNVNPPTMRGAHQRVKEISDIFDPLLQRSGARLLSFDLKALGSACVEAGNVPHDFLVYFVHGPNGRGSRPISNPRAVASIVKECRLNWERLEHSRPAPAPVDRATAVEWARAVLEMDPGRLDKDGRPMYSDDDREAARRVLAEHS